MPLSVLCLKCSPTVNVEEGAGDDAVDVASVLAHVLNKHSVWADFFKINSRIFGREQFFFFSLLLLTKNWFGVNIIGRATMLAESWPAPPNQTCD